MGVLSLKVDGRLIRCASRSRRGAKWTVASPAGLLYILLVQTSSISPGFTEKPMPVRKQYPKIYLTPLRGKLKVEEVRRAVRQVRAEREVRAQAQAAGVK
jgi:hypothetical protein